MFNLQVTKSINRDYGLGIRNERTRSDSHSPQNTNQKISNTRHSNTINKSSNLQVIKLSNHQTKKVAPKDDFVNIVFNDHYAVTAAAATALAATAFSFLPNMLRISTTIGLAIKSVE